jgi:copper chaperone
MAVQRAIKAIDPQAAIAIDRAKNQVDVDSQHPKETLVKAIADEGYTVVA